MGFQIEDGSGHGFQTKVTDEQKLRTYSTVEDEISYESETNGRAYSWSHSYNSTAADTILWVKNINTTENLIIDQIVIGSDTATQFTIHLPESTTGAGTAITGTNLNRHSGKDALATAYGDETTNTQANVIVQGFIAANTTQIIHMEGSIILGYQDQIAVDLVADVAIGCVTMLGLYHTAK